MARPSVAPRSLSSMEELEKLEQSITLTLQEIDHNFSKAHRIVTASIIPVVEQYGEHSRAVWEASKFWKHFFEASANVSLSGYEELANDDDSTVMEEGTVMQDDEDDDETREYTQGHDADVAGTPGGGGGDSMHGDESILDEAALLGSTPRPPATRILKNDTTTQSSPFGSTKRDAMKTEEDDTTILQDGEDSTVLFAQRTAQLPEISMTPRRDQIRGHAEQQSAQRRNKDPLLHRVLDKNYRVGATPHRPGIRISPLKKDEGKQKAAWQQHEGTADDSLMSSPEMAPPTLRSEVFMSPYKLMAQQRAAAAAKAASAGPRTPGVSVQTPAGKRPRDVFASSGMRDRDDGGAAESRGRQKYEIDWESDEDGDDGDLYAGMSPPKTIQFALPPSKLLQTPAREASRRIVDDILMDAGADLGSSEYSPTMVKMNEDILNDSF